MLFGTEHSMPKHPDHTDWARLMPGVADALLGEPTTRNARELRYGRKGSLAINIEDGTWFDHEASTGGGVLDLAERELGSRTTALTWLENEGFIERQSTSRRNARTPARRSRPQQATVTPDTRPTTNTPCEPTADPLAMQLWTAARPARATSCHTYLTRRNAWPPFGIGPELPPTVRWLAHAAAPERQPPPPEKMRWPGLPRHAIGAMLFAWRAPGEIDSPIQAITAIPIDQHCARMPWWASSGPKTVTVGSLKGAACETRPGAPDEPVHAAEGEVDALALALSPWVSDGRVLAVGGTPGMRRLGELTLGEHLSVVIHPDGDPPGRAAARAATQALREAGRTYSRVRYAPKTDPAHQLAEWINEHRAISESEGGARPDVAIRNAWRDLLNVCN